jgi:hypothetical protein
MYLSHCDNLLIEECILDSNGYKAGVAPPTIFNHNIYINNQSSRQHVVRNNIISRAASHGVQARAGGVITGNLFVSNPIALLVGGGDTPVAGGVEAIVSENVILMGVDISESLPRGFGIDLKNLRSGTISRNVIADKVTGNVAFAIGSYVSGGPRGIGVQNTEISDNVVSNWHGNFDFGTFQSPYYDGCTVRANRVVSDGNKPNNFYVGWNGTALPTFTGNRYQGVQSSNRMFRYSTTMMNFEAWVTNHGETGATMEATSLSTPFDFTAYIASESLGGDLESFLSQARQQSRSNWRASYTAAVINLAVRNAYGVTPR